MAVERDFELLDDYLSNRLTGQDKVAFEEKLQSDPELKQELNIQKSLIDGIRQARVVELKSMLNTIPVSTIPTGQSAIVKVGAWIIAAGITATSLYFFLDRNTEKELPESEPETEEIAPTEPDLKEEDSAVSLSENTKAEVDPNPEPEEPKEVKPKTVTPAKKPAINVYDPTKENTPASFNAAEQVEIISKAFVTSSVEVETESYNKDYKFHYVFRNKKLVLYGIQEKDLYEILEFISGEKRTVFLFYKANYYWLDSAQSNPAPLIPIKDRTLLRKLKEYRGNNQ
jgi:hypothetical protein